VNHHSRLQVILSFGQATLSLCKIESHKKRLFRLIVGFLGPPTPAVSRATKGRAESVGI
jgi:hypothetical protein